MLIPFPCSLRKHSVTLESICIMDVISSNDRHRRNDELLLEAIATLPSE